MMLALVLRQVEGVHEEVTILLNPAVHVKSVCNGKLNLPFMVVDLRLHHSMAQRRNAQPAFGGGLKL